MYLCQRVEHIIGIVQSLPLSVLILLPAGPAAAPPLTPSQGAASQLPSRCPCSSPLPPGASQRQASTQTNPRRRWTRGLASGQRQRRRNQSPQAYSAPRSPLAAARGTAGSVSTARVPGCPAARHGLTRTLSRSRPPSGQPNTKSFLRSSPSLLAVSSDAARTAGARSSVFAVFVPAPLSPRCCTQASQNAPLLVCRLLSACLAKKKGNTQDTGSPFFLEGMPQNCIFSPPDKK